MTSIQTSLKRRKSKGTVPNMPNSGIGSLAEPSIKNAGRVVNRRSPLPNSRAVVGGLLMAVAVLGTFVAYQQATQKRSTIYIVANTKLTPGHVIQRADLGTVTGELPAAVASRAFIDSTALVGKTLIGPVDRGELLQQANVVSEPATFMTFEVPMLVEPGRYPASLRKGDSVDVLVTIGQGAEAKTTVVAKMVRIADVGVSNAGALSTGATAIRLVAADEATETSLANAGAAGKVTLVTANMPVPVVVKP